MKELSISQIDKVCKLFKELGLKAQYIVNEDLKKGMIIGLPVEANKITDLPRYDNPKVAELLEIIKEAGSNDVDYSIDNKYLAIPNAIISYELAKERFLSDN